MFEQSTADISADNFQQYATQTPSSVRFKVDTTGLQQHDIERPPAGDRIKNVIDVILQDAKVGQTKGNAQAEAPPLDLGEWDAGDDVGLPPPRAWLLGNIFARTFMSSLLADGAVGKTSLRLAQLLSLALGRSLTGEHVFQRCRVLVISLDDNRQELERRVLALLLHYGIDRAEIKGWLFLSAPGGTRGKIMTVDRKGNATIGPLAGIIEDAIIRRKVDIVSIDPFVKSHKIEENNNSGIDEIVQVLTDLAIKHNIALDAPHHTSKGTPDPGNANRGRGASSMKDAARLVYTLTPMSADEAKAFDVSEEDRRFFVRMDSGKVNIAPARLAKWFKLIGVRLDNGNDLYPNGDEVQVVEPWTPPETWAAMDMPLLNQILDKLDAGLPDGSRYSTAPRAETRAAWQVVLDLAPSKTEPQARDMIKTWVRNGVLYVEEYDDPVRRSKAKGLYVDTAKRPGNEVHV
jgi:RecA-family ATPase